MKKLNARGFGHDVLMVAFVGIFAIAGVGFLVASHAGSCNPVKVHGKVVSAASSAKCKTVVSTPVTTAARVVRCTISGIPAKPVIGQTITPTVTVNNTSTLTRHLRAAAFVFKTYDTKSKATTILSVTPPNADDVQIAPGATFTFNGPPYTPVARTAGAVRGSYVFTSSSAACSKTFTLPPAPAKKSAV